MESIENVGDIHQDTLDLQAKKSCSMQIKILNSYPCKADYLLPLLGIVII
jgi:hypothetical protein